MKRLHQYATPMYDMLDRTYYMDARRTARTGIKSYTSSVCDVSNAYLNSTASRAVRRLAQYRLL